MKTYVKIIIPIALSIMTMAFVSPTLPSSSEIVKKVNSRNEGKHVIQNFDMLLTNKKGKTQSRKTIIYRKDYDGERKSMIVFQSPTNVKGTGFLSFDYHDNSKDDDQWLYLPALKKTRRISASNRGDYFLGTDFTYEDIKLGSKMSVHDYNGNTIKTEVIDGKKCYLIESKPKNDKIKKELGYSKVQTWVDSEIWMVRKAKYWDEAGNLLKTSNVSSIQKIDGIWTIQKLEAVNHKTGHKTTITFSNVDYKTSVEDDLFTEESLMRSGK